MAVSRAAVLQVVGARAVVMKGLAVREVSTGVVARVSGSTAVVEMAAALMAAAASKAAALEMAAAMLVVATTGKVARVETAEEEEKVALVEVALEGI